MLREYIFKGDISEAIGFLMALRKTYKAVEFAPYGETRENWDVFLPGHRPTATVGRYNAPRPTERRLYIDDVFKTPSDEPRANVMGEASLTLYRWPGGQTKIVFTDGHTVRPNHSPSRPPIGQAFADFAEFVVSELEGLTATKTETPVKAKGKQGPRNLSTKDKLAAYLEWKELDRDIDPIKLEEWLEVKFGTHPDGTLFVGPSTFHGWKRYLKNS